MPEFVSLLLVECGVCETVYAPFPPSATDLAQLYGGASFDTASEEQDAADVYVRAMAEQLPDTRGGALEIGCGTGAMLPRLILLGFQPVVGIEPSSAAVAAARSNARALIRHETFDETVFLPESFSLVCCFQTIEHLPDPTGFVRAAFRLLAPGGRLMIVAHDRRSLLNRLLGRKSPIIDIEHLQLYSRRSLVELLIRAGFETAPPRSLANRYSLRYWMRLLPLSPGLRRRIIMLVEVIGLGDWRITIDVGNLLAVARKPIARDS